jgi:voltage-gated potassium channel
MSRPGSLPSLLATLRLRRGAGRSILFTKPPVPPEATLVIRGLVVLALLAVVVAVFWWDRDGLKDNIDDQISFVDVIYFTAVSVTTVGYGDIVPVTDRARLIDAFFVTPIRLIVWLIFVGTAYQLLFQRLFEDLRMTRLQRDLTDHVLILGYGGGGATAAGELVAQGLDPRHVVIIDRDEGQVRLAAEGGFIGISGDATSEELLRVAGAERARAAVVALDRDDAAVLAVLTLRHLSKRLRLVATVRAEENRKLLATAGADVVIAPFQLGGFLVADAVNTRDTVDVLTDLLSCTGPMQVVEAPAKAAELGLAARELPDKLVIAIRRGSRLIRFWEDPRLMVETGDVLIAVARSNGGAADPAGP